MIRQTMQTDLTTELKIRGADSRAFSLLMSLLPVSLSH